MSILDGRITRAMRDGSAKYDGMAWGQSPY